MVALDVVEVRRGEIEQRADGPEEVVMDAHNKEDGAADKKDGQASI